MKDRIPRIAGHPPSLTRLAALALVLAACPSSDPAPEVLRTVPAFQLVERDGLPLTLARLRGSVWVADFMFTRCENTCPMQAGRMQALAQRFRDRPDVKMVSFSVDAGHDTPEVLTAYAARLGADPGRWLFATGDPNAIHRLAQEGFGVSGGAPPVPDGAGTEGAAPPVVAHSARLMLVDREGRIRGSGYPSDDDEAMARLAKDVRALLDERGGTP